MNIKVAIADRDESYLDRLGEGLQRYKHLTCTRYSDPETFQRALLSRTFDVVLFDVSILSEKGDSIPDLSNVTLPIFLYHGDTEIGILPSYIEKIDKYQRVSGIYRRMTQAALSAHQQHGAGRAGSAHCLCTPLPEVQEKL